MAKHLVKVAITYCAECGYEPQTLALAEALMKRFRDELSEIELIPWHEGSFDVTVDGELVHSMFREGGFAEHSVVFDAVKRHQSAPAEPMEPNAAASGA